MNLLDAYEYAYKFICLDFAKAFDKVCTRRLEIKLRAIGTDSVITDWKMAFLTNWMQVVSAHGDSGQVFFCESGPVTRLFQSPSLASHRGWND
jgi:hypothetical protein